MVPIVSYGIGTIRERGPVHATLVTPSLGCHKTINLESTTKKRMQGIIVLMSNSNWNRLVLKQLQKYLPIIQIYLCGLLSN